MLQLPTVDDFVLLFKGSEVGRTLLREREEKARADRQVLVEQRQALVKALPGTVEKHTKLVAALRTKALASQEKYLADEGALIDAQRAQQAAIHALESPAADLERQLRRLADPTIVEARRAIDRHLDRRDLMRFSAEDAGKGFDSWTSKPLQLHKSNVGAYDRLMAAIQQARAGLDELMLQNPSNVEAAIAAIVKPVDDALARLDEMTPVT